MKVVFFYLFFHFLRLAFGGFRWSLSKIGTLLKCRNSQQKSLFLHAPSFLFPQNKTKSQSHSPTKGYVVVSELINYTGIGEVNQSLVLLNSDPLGAHQLSYQPLEGMVLWDWIGRSGTWDSSVFLCCFKSIGKWKDVERWWFLSKTSLEVSPWKILSRWFVICLVSLLRLVKTKVATMLQLLVVLLVVRSFFRDKRFLR